MNFKGLDRIHDMLEKHPSGIDRLYTNGLITELDMEYLLQRQRQDAIVNEKLSEWESQIIKSGGFEIHNEVDPRRKVVLIGEAIDAIERASLAFDVFERALFLELSGLKELMGARYSLRNQILLLEMPYSERITDAEIEQAREVRLDRVIPNLPRSKKIACPFHKEKTPSFHVSAWGYCFGCGAHVDSIGWLTAFHKMSFVQAVRHLCSGSYPQVIQTISLVFVRVRIWVLLHF